MSRLMRAGLVQQAKDYLAAELSILPIKEDKTPIGLWGNYQNTRMKPEATDKQFTEKDVRGVGIVCGAVSGNLEVIDVDCKYDLTGDLWINFKNLILLEDSLANIFSEFLIATTIKKGYHIYYKCEEIEGNQKLALNIEGKTIIETRGEGGYVAAYPSVGYEFIQGDINEIPTIGIYQRAKLFEIADSLSHVDPIVTEEPETKITEVNGLSCWDDYNNRTTNKEILELLIKHDWSEVRTDKTGRTFVLRPSDNNPSSAAYSGNIYRIKKDNKEVSLFSVFTENGHPFTANVIKDGILVKDEKGKFKKQAYTPFSVYTLLEHKGDRSKAAKELYKLGYGERLTKPEGIATDSIKVSAIDKATGDIIEISKPGSSLTKKDIRAAGNNEFIITSPSNLATVEVLAAIDLIQEEGKRIYVVEGNEPEIISYHYQLQAILNKYATREEKNEGLTDRDTNNLLIDIITTSTKLLPIDKNIFLTSFTNHTGIKEMGVTKKDLDDTVNKIATTRDFKKLLTEVTRLQDQGEVDKAISLLQKQSSSLSKTNTGATVDKILARATREEVRKLIQAEPDSLATGYSLMDGLNQAMELELPSGALSIIAARTSHRKTCLMMNMALNIARSKSEGEVYFLSYEESREEIINKLMNIDINKELQPGNNLKYIKAYYKKGGVNFNNKDLTEGENKFYNDLIDTGKLNVSYPSLETTDLCLAIEELKARANPKVIFIDYIQQLRIVGMGTQPKQIQLQEICERLREVAIKTGLPIVLGAQFNRNVNQEGNIDSSNIREAGDIEQTANLVLGLWDRNFTKQDDTQKDRKGKAAKHEPGKLYIEVLKGRGVGAGAYGELPYNGNTWKIDNYGSTNSSPKYTF